MKTEIRLFFTALMFFTRLPCPPGTDHSETYLQRSRKYFPLVGWIVGGIAALTFGLAGLVLPAAVAVALSMAASVWATGAFHEDGFADVCDGFGGGWTKAQILTIMKDSRVGAYGAIGMVLLLGLKFAALYELSRLSYEWVMLGLVGGHGLSRLLASWLAQTHDYVQDIDQSKVRPIASQPLTPGAMLFSTVTGLLPLLFFPWPIWLLLPLLAAPYFYLTRFFGRRLGGYTGDCLGATQQVLEVCFYLILLVGWKFI